MMGAWGWWGILGGIIAGALLRIGVNAHRRVVRERDGARFALRQQLAARAGEAMVLDLMDEWARLTDDVEWDDGDEAAHHFANFLANRTGETILTTQLDGDGLVIAIPDSEAPGAH